MGADSSDNPANSLPLNESTSSEPAANEPVDTSTSTNTNTDTDTAAPPPTAQKKGKDNKDAEKAPGFLEAAKKRFSNADAENRKKKDQSKSPNAHVAALEEGAQKFDNIARQCAYAGFTGNIKFLGQGLNLLYEKFKDEKAQTQKEQTPAEKTAIDKDLEERASQEGTNAGQGEIELTDFSSRSRKNEKETRDNEPMSPKQSEEKDVDLSPVSSTSSLAPNPSNNRKTDDLKHDADETRKAGVEKDPLGDSPITTPKL